MKTSMQDFKRICVSKEKQHQKLRTVTVYLSRVLVALGFHANQVTLLAIILSLIGAIMFFFGKIWIYLIGALLIDFAYFLDYCDGEVARYRNECSITGLFLDQFSHQIIALFIFFPLSYGIFINTGWKPILIFGFLGSVFSVSVVYTSLYWGLVRRKEKELKKHEPGEKIIKHKPHKKILLQQGEITGKYSFIYKIIKKINFIWTQPGYFVELTIITLLEVINLYIHLFEPYTLITIFVIAFAIIVTLLQTSSFVVNLISKSAEKNYEFLFGNK